MNEHLELGGVLNSQNAISLYKVGKYEEAIKITNNLLAINQRDFYALYIKGLSLVDLKQKDEAKRVIKRVLDITPDNDEMASFRGSALYMLSMLGGSDYDFRGLPGGKVNIENLGLSSCDRLVNNNAFGDAEVKPSVGESLGINIVGGYLIAMTLPISGPYLAWIAYKEWKIKRELEPALTLISGIEKRKYEDMEYRESGQAERDKNITIDLIKKRLGSKDSDLVNRLIEKHIKGLNERYIENEENKERERLKHKKEAEEAWADSI